MHDSRMAKDQMAKDQTSNLQIISPMLKLTEKLPIQPPHHTAF